MALQQFQSCIEECYRCADACDHCTVSCLGEFDVRALKRCIRLNTDCAEICRLTAASMARGSELVGTLCTVCSDICDICADECAQHELPQCQECAEACRRCAEACRRMVVMQRAGVPAH